MSKRSAEGQGETTHDLDKWVLVDGVLVSCKDFLEYAVKLCKAEMKEGEKLGAINVRLAEGCIEIAYHFSSKSFPAKQLNGDSTVIGEYARIPTNAIAHTNFFGRREKTV